MWAAYGDTYRGLCIVFKPTALDGIAGRVQKVRYISGDAKQEFRAILEGAADEVAKKGLDKNGLMYSLEAVSAIISKITAVKHTAWSYEKEVRILIAQNKKSPFERGDMRLDFCSEMPDGKTIPWQRPLIRYLGSEAIPYIPFSFGKYHNGQWDARRAISEVILGPKSPFEIEEVEAAMKARGFVDFRISKSECLMR